MDGKAFVLYVLPVFAVPMLIDFAIHLSRKRNPNYRINDLLLNFSLSILSVLGSLAFAGIGLTVYSALYHELAPVRLDSAAPGTWLLAFVVYDFLYYWLHRAHHRIGVLWAVHEVHHSGEDMNYGLAIRQPILGELTTWPFYVPLALFGIELEVFLGVTLVQLLYQYSLHNSYVPPLGVLEKWFQTPALHRVHHASNSQYLDRNYGNILAIWDRLFGTYQAEQPDHPPRYGLTTTIHSWNPWAFNAHFFRRLLVKRRSCEGWAEQLRCWFAPPEWEPRFRSRAATCGSSDRQKYDVRLTTAATAYCLVRFMGVLSLFIALLWYSDKGFTALGILALSLLLAGTYELGKLLEGNKRAWSEQSTVLTMLLLVAIVSGIASGRFVVTWTAVGFVALSAAILLAVRGRGIQPSRFAASS